MTLHFWVNCMQIVSLIVQVTYILVSHDSSSEYSFASDSMDIRPTKTKIHSDLTVIEKVKMTPMGWRFTGELPQWLETVKNLPVTWDP